MNKETLDKMLVDNDILYIYNLPASLYDLSEDWNKYIIVTKDNYEFKYPDDKIIIYNISYWFKMVLSGNILCWKCACLPKKYIIKEYVKVLIYSNPIQLRKDFDNFLEICHNDLNIESCRELLIFVKLANQIIDNHKIINFKIIKKDYEILKNAESLHKEFYNLLEEPYNELKNKTDELILNKKINDYLNAKRDI